MTRRVCVRCGRVGSLQFAKFPQGDACTAEKACRRRIQGISYQIEARIVPRVCPEIRVPCLRVSTQVTGGAVS